MTENISLQKIIQLKEQRLLTLQAQREALEPEPPPEILLDIKQTEAEIVLLQQQLNLINVQGSISPFEIGSIQAAIVNQGGSQTFSGDLNISLDFSQGAEPGPVTGSPTLPATRGQSAPLPTSSPPPAGQGPRLENPTGLFLTIEQTTVLATMFAGHERVVLQAEFGDGLSGSRVFLVQPIQAEGIAELPAVVKIGPVDLIAQEWRAYQHHIHRRWRGAAGIEEAPAWPQGCSQAGLRYPLLGDSGAFQVESLLGYSRSASLDNTLLVLERLFRKVGPNWQLNRTEPDFSFQTGYDFLLPVNYVIEPGLPAEAPVQAVALTPATVATQPRRSGDIVRLSGFVVTEVDVRRQTVTLDVNHDGEGLQAGYRLRLQPVEAIEQFAVGQRPIQALEGTIRQTRSETLAGEARQILEIDPSSPHIPLPDGRLLPNPLVALPGLLQRVRHVKVASLHGDMNLTNVLVNPETRDVYLIDFSRAKQSHVLLDLLWLESQIVTHLLPKLARGQPPATVMHQLYNRLHQVQLEQAASDQGEAGPTGLEKPYGILKAIRHQVQRGNLLFEPGDWGEYYQGLVICLLGTLKFGVLNQTAKQLAFYGAATLLALVETPQS